MNTLIVSTLLLASGISSHAFAETCPSTSLCPTFTKQIASCGKAYSEPKCESFVDTYQKLSMSYDCKRASDTKAVPAIFLCDEANKSNPLESEKAATVLAKLKFQKARDFFASADFRNTLAGESADHWRKHSLGAAKDKAKK